MHILWWQTWWVIFALTTTHIPSSPYRTLDICPFLLIANQNRYVNEVLNMRIWWQHRTWVVLVSTTTHVPSFVTVAHKELWIFVFFVISQSDRYANEVLNMHIWWQQTSKVVLVFTTTHIPSFVNVVHKELWIFAFFVVSQSEQICKWGIKYAHLVMADQVESTVLCAPTTHIPNFTKSILVFSLGKQRFTQ